jgi:SPX domain protein involved in polyphosphate accumulation
MSEVTRRWIFAGSSIASVALEAEIDDCYHRLHSGDILMNTAASDAEGYGNRTAHQIAVHPFIEAIDAEINRLANVLANHKDAIESSAEALLKNADGLLRRRDKMSDTAVSNQLSETRRLATILENKTICINAEAMKTEKEFRRIVFLADTKLGTVCVDQAELQFSKKPWVDKVSTGHVVKILSDIFSFIRDIEDRGKDKGAEEWKAPASFERVTTKYWVKDEALPEVLLKSACELPILVYGRSGILTENPKDPSEGKGKFWKTMASPISSVYFDSDNMDLYKERIKRSEGAQLFRVRWYGDKPRNDEVIYLELKTHHECWINNKSVKERVGIVQRNMLTLMDILDGQWTSDFAKTLVIEASPDDSEAEIEASTALLLEIRALFCRLELRPCVRTSYTRAAFQSSTNNELRLTIDRDITVIDETSVRNEGSWCIEDKDNVPIHSFLKVPYSVFEVKQVSGGLGPIFLEELQESNAIVEAPKFSKFLTGASLHNANKVNMLPWWAEDPLFEPIFKMRQSTRFSKKIESSKALDADFLVSPTSSAGGTSKESLHHSSDGSDLVAAEEGRGTNSSARGDNTKKGGLFGLIGMRSRHHAKTDNSKPTAAPRSPARVEPKSFFANERTFIQWVTVGSLFMLVAALVS